MLLGCICWFFFFYRYHNFHLIWHLTCRITAWCVGRWSRGQPSCRPPPSWSERCTRTGRCPQPQGCATHTHTLCFVMDHGDRKRTALHPLMPSSSPCRWCSDAESTSRWVWAQPIVFRPESRLATPPTGCARSPRCSNQSHPTGSTRPYGSRWRRAGLRKTWNTSHVSRSALSLNISKTECGHFLFRFSHRWLRVSWNTDRRRWWALESCPGGRSGGGSQPMTWRSPSRPSAWRWLKRRKQHRVEFTESLCYHWPRWPLSELQPVVGAIEHPGHRPKHSHDITIHSYFMF